MDVKEELFQKLTTTVNLLLRLLKVERQDRKDVGQDVMKAVLAKEGELQGDDLERWTRAVARKRAADYFRKKKKMANFVNIEEVQQMATSQPDPYEQYAAEELFAAIARANLRMSSFYRRVIELLAARASREQMMQELNIRDATEMKEKVYRARKRLRELLSEERIEV